MAEVIAPSALSAKTDSLRIPPHSIEAEQAVLGGLLLDNSSWDRIADLVTEADFYRADHKHIFRAIGELTERSEPCDAVTIAEYLASKKLANETGGLAYVGRLVADTPTAANIKAYANIVRERALLRGLIRVGGEIADLAFNADGKQTHTLVDEAEKRVFEIAEHGKRRGAGFMSLKEILPGAIDRIDALHAAGGDITGISTGFDKFDDLTSGMQPGDLVIIAGRPSMGKTSFAINIAENAAIGGGVPTAIFSMEMSSEQISFRLISSLGRIHQGQLRSGNFPDEEWSRINGAVQQLNNAPIYIDDTPALSPTEVRARARRLKRECDLGLIVLDYLQLMSVTGTTENRATEISEISRNLKALAKELRVPVIALSQLNRSVEQRTDKRPVMSDLRESGSIEQDADLIAMIYREEVYDQDTPRKGVADIIIAKQRNGPIGTFPLTFLGEYTRFENFVPDSYGEDPFQ